MPLGNELLDRLIESSPALSGVAELREHRLLDRLDDDGAMIDIAFPATAAVSLLHVADDGETAELALVGRDGFVHPDILLGTRRLTAGTVTQVQVPGSVWHLPLEDLESILGGRGDGWRVLATYARILSATTQRQVLCNANHPIAQRVCKWLLVTADRAGSDEFALTQTFMSEMLGVRRASVSEHQNTLRASGLITYGGGRLRIIDRPALERRTCSCYSFTQQVHAATPD